MIPINVTFQRLDEISVSDALGMVGVYVLWDNRSTARPTYIGQGNVINRLSEHAGRFALPILGYAAFIEKQSPKKTKLRLLAIETLLLYVGASTDRYPNNNASQGSYGRLWDALEDHSTLRLSVRGYDPFVPPLRPRLILGTKRITLKDTTIEDEMLVHDWTYRRTRQLSL